MVVGERVAAVHCRGVVPQHVALPKKAGTNDGKGWMSPAISPNSSATIRASKKRVQDTGEMLKPMVETNEHNGLLTKSMTCWLQICCRIFGQFAARNRGLCSSCLGSVPYHVRTCRRPRDETGFWTKPTARDRRREARDPPGGCFDRIIVRQPCRRLAPDMRRPWLMRAGELPGRSRCR